jgi:hypothetical protein
VFSVWSAPRNSGTVFSALSLTHLYNESVFVARRDQTGDRIGELSRRRSEFRESAVQGD